MALTMFELDSGGPPSTHVSEVESALPSELSGELASGKLTQRNTQRPVLTPTVGHWAPRPGVTQPILQVTTLPGVNYSGIWKPTFILNLLSFSFFFLELLLSCLV